MPSSARHPACIFLAALLSAPSLFAMVNCNVAVTGGDVDDFDGSTRRQDGGPGSGEEAGPDWPFPGKEDGGDGSTAPTAPILALGDSHACARVSPSSVKCWGAGTGGALGLGDTNHRGDGAGEMGSALPTVALGSRAILQLSLGNGYSCARFDDGSLRCWGENASGRLGLGDTADRGDEANEMGDALPFVDVGGRVEYVATGTSHTCVLMENDQIKCWGNNFSGQLGRGDTAPRGDQAGELGTSLPVVLLGAGRTVKGIATGAYHSCAVLDDDAVKCWGENNVGELGVGDIDWRGDDQGEMGNSLPAVALGTNAKVTQLSAGRNHTCAVLEGGSLKCWGYNNFGQIGSGATATLGDGPGEMGDALPAVDVGGAKVVEVAAGWSHTCARLEDGAVKCWGDNQHGQLGLGDKTTRGRMAGQMGTALPSVDLGTGRKAVSIAVARFYSCAVLDDAAIKCWGYNDRGQLGLGDTNSRGDDAGEMGDALPAVDL